jgi:hypothetical protein
MFSRALQLGFVILGAIELPGENPFGPFSSTIGIDCILPTVTGTHSSRGLRQEKYFDRKQKILNDRVRGSGDSGFHSTLSDPTFIHSETKGLTLVWVETRQERGQEACPVHRRPSSDH